jgi:hypothetical protein
MLLRLTRPILRDALRQGAGCLKLSTSISIDPDEIRVTEVAHGGGPIALEAGPQVAPRKSTKDRRAARMSTFALQCVKDLFDGIGHD